MLVTSHVLAGAILGRTLARRPLAAFAAGVASHFVMDACPHWGDPGAGMDRRFLRVARCDGCCALAAMALAGAMSPARSRGAVTAAMLGGALVDADKPMRHFFGWDPFPEPVTRFHRWIQKEAPHRMPHEVVTAAWLGAAALTALRYRHGG